MKLEASQVSPLGELGLATASRESEYLPGDCEMTHVAISRKAVQERSGFFFHHVFPGHAIDVTQKGRTDRLPGDDEIVCRPDSSQGDFL